MRWNNVDGKELKLEKKKKLGWCGFLLDKESNVAEFGKCQKKKKRLYNISLKTYFLFYNISFNHSYN